MSPAVDLDQFKFTVCVDWVELRVCIQRDAKGQATNGHTLYRLLNHLHVSYAYAVNPGDGDAATEFLIRIQAPNKLRDVRAVVDRVAAHRPLATEPTIAALEIAFDALPKPPTDRAALDQMTLRLMYRLLPPSRELRRVRQADSARGDQNALSPNAQPLAPHKTFYIGAYPVANRGDRRKRKEPDPDYVRGTLIDRYERRCGDGEATAVKYRRPATEVALDDVQWRVYQKVTDEQFADDGERQPTRALPADQHRARAEVTLSGQILRDLKLETLEDLAVFDFTEIAKRNLLRFATVTAPPFFADEFRQYVFVEAMGLNEHSPACLIHPIWHKGSRGRAVDVSPFLALDGELNERLQKRLKRLTTTFKK